MEIEIFLLRGVALALALAPAVFLVGVILYSRKLLAAPVCTEGIDAQILPLEIDPNSYHMLFETLFVSAVALAFTFFLKADNVDTFSVGAVILGEIIIATGWIGLLYWVEIPRVLYAIKNQREQALGLTKGLKFVGALKRTFRKDGINFLVLTSPNKETVHFICDVIAKPFSEEGYLGRTFVMFYTVEEHKGRKVNWPKRMIQIPLEPKLETEAQAAPVAVSTPAAG